MDVHRHCFKIRKAADAINSFLVGIQRATLTILASIIAGGHVLITDVPGTGKTLMAKLLARLLGLSMKRVQMTPDTLPSDIVGVKVWRPERGVFEFVRGPIFANVVLVDELNRAPPRVQSALLEAMQELEVTVDGETHPLPRPFTVIATQNPLEHEGTYPLPEAELDRFLVNVALGYPPTLADEVELLRRRLRWGTDDPSELVSPIMGKDEILAMQSMAESIYVDEVVLEYIALLVRAIRADPRVEVGPSPRAGIHVLRLSRALALANCRDYVIPDDVKAVAIEVLRHRMRVAPSLDPESVITEHLNGIPVPKR